MFNYIKTDLKRYAKKRKDCKSTLVYYFQYLLIILFHEGAISLIGYRISAWFTKHRMRNLGYITSKLFFFITGIYIHHETIIGSGCKIDHSSVVIHAHSIGKYFECSANITIGQKVPYDSPYPAIGDYVNIGAGARVFCNVGSETVIGANAVVVNPIESGNIAVGIPAKVIGMRDRVTQPEL